MTSHLASSAVGIPVLQERGKSNTFLYTIYRVHFIFMHLYAFLTTIHFDGKLSAVSMFDSLKLNDVITVSEYVFSPQHFHRPHHMFWSLSRHCWMM